MKWSKWGFTRDKDKSGTVRFRIRRYQTIEGRIKWESYDADKYRHCKSESDVAKFVEQLNHRYKSKLALVREAYQFKHRFITQDLLDGFRDKLVEEISNQSHARYMYSVLERHCLHWFINQAGLVDPLDWKRNEGKWGQALRGDMKPLNNWRDKRAEHYRIFDEPANPDTLKKRIQVMNRFIAYLHAQIPETMPGLILEPISKSQMRTYKADYRLNGEYAAGQFITPAHWQLMRDKLNKRIVGLVEIGYDLGLRRSEILGLLPTDIYEDCLEVTRQIAAFPNTPVYGPLKNRKPRQVPYWFTTPEKVFDAIPEESKKMRQDTFGVLFADEMTRLKLPYTLHDLRRSFITRAFRAGKLPRDIQLAVGHESIETTMRYAKDDRQFERKQFVPKKTG